MTGLKASRFIPADTDMEQAYDISSLKFVVSVLLRADNVGVSSRLCIYEVPYPSATGLVAVRSLEDACAAADIGDGVSGLSAGLPCNRRGKRRIRCSGTAGGAERRHGSR